MIEEGDSILDIPEFESLSLREGGIMKILDEFWYGNIHPNERHGESNIEMIKRHEGALMKSLDEKNKEIIMMN